MPGSTTDSFLPQGRVTMRARPPAIVLRAFVLIACLAAVATIAVRSQGLRAEVEVVGSRDFVGQVEKALALLESRSPDAYLIVTNNVKRIQQGDRSGMWAYQTPPTYEMSDRTALVSVTWCAATIAHDSFHSKLYHDCRRDAPGPVPDVVWTGTVAERLCMKHQLAVMKLIGAPQSEIDHATRLADGSYVKDHETWRDYQDRKY